MPPAVHPHSLSVRLIWLRRKLQRLLHWHGKALLWLIVAVLLLWLAAAGWLQWWLYPHLESYRPRLMAELSQRIGRPVGIGELQGGWRGGLPYLQFRQLSLDNGAGQPALTLADVEATLSWWPLLLGDLRFARLTAHRPSLALTRDAQGIIRLAGLPLNQDSGDGALGNWVLRQHDIAIVDGRISWHDQLRGAAPLQLDHVDFSLENQLFGRHKAELQATPPAALASPFKLSARWRGDDITRLSDWQGSVESSMQQVDLALLGQWLPYPVEVKRGRGRLDLTLEFDAGRLTASDATLALQSASLRLAPELAMLDVAGLSGRLRWRDKQDERELRLSELKLVAEGGKLLDGSQASLRLHKGGGGEIEAAGLTLPGLANLPPALPLPNALRRHLAGMQPSGRLDKLSMRWQGDWREPRSYAGQIGFTGLGLNAPLPWPSVGPLDGELSLDQQSGRLALRGQRVRFALADLFEAPLTFERLRLAADWQRQGKGWTVQLRDFLASNTDLDATATASWAWPGEGLGTVALDATVGRLTASKVADYLPLVIGADTRSWLKQSLVAGEARDARFSLQGPLAAFPFADGRSGHWQMVTQARGVTLDYAPAWPAVTGLDGEVSIIGSRLAIKAGGRIAGTEIRQANAQIDDLASSTSIRIDGDVRGKTADFFRFIADSPLNASLGGLGSHARAAGEGQLALQLDIPFDNADATRVAGKYRLAGNRLQIGDAMPELSELRGEVSFTEQGVSGRGLQASALGGTVRADLGSGAGGAVQVTASGRLDATQAARRYAIPFAERISGSSDYRVTVSLPRQGWQVAVEAPLRDVRIDLPAPLGKPAGEARPLKLQLDGSEQAEQWNATLGSQLSLLLLRSPQAGGWRTERGEIHLGAGLPNAANRGIWLTATLPELALDPWLKLLDGPARGTDALALAGMELKTGRLLVAGSQLDDVLLRAIPQAEAAWQLTASSRQIEGKAQWAPQGKGRLHARLTRLALPLPEAPPGDGRVVRSERQLPALDVMAEDFRYKDHALGQLDVKAQQQRDNWLIDSLTLVNPDGRLSMQGVWQPGSGEDSGTRVKLDVVSDNIGKLLGRFGYPETVRRGSGSLRGELAWRGSPLSPDYPSLSGSLSLSASNGQFAKVDPGVGRLLGVLSLQSIQRRLTLDFRDIFSDGFAFDHIEGDSKVMKGVLSTDNLSIVGPAAQVLFRGEADVARETQKLRVRIVPTVGDSVALGAGVALANPALAVGALLLQRVFKDPLGRMIAYEYDITGRWDDPQVTRLAAPPAK